MKLKSRFSTPLLTRTVQVLRSIQALLRAWMPQPVRVLVPIPIRIERRTHAAVDREARRRY